MAYLTVDNVTKAFDGQPILQDISLSIAQGEIMCLLGASGSGKTTLLRIIAGLEQTDSGQLCIEGEPLINQPVHTRGFGLMFQNFALFPHMNVAQNVMFGLKMQNHPMRERQTRMREVLELVGLEDFQNRDVSQLSGGERQRVALARSLAPNPRLLMLDEPLGSLDAALRERLMVDLRRIIKQLGLTAIYVTHDQQEAFAVADRIAIMNAGRIEQKDTPQHIYHRPQTVFVARFLGLNNIVPIIRQNGHTLETPLGKFDIATDSTEPPTAILIHPDELQLTQPDEGKILGSVTECVFQGNQYRLRVDVSDDLVFKLRSMYKTAPTVGDQVGINFDADTIIPLLG